MGTVRHVLVVHVDQRDDAALDEALAIVHRSRARLTIAVSVPDAPSSIALTGVNPERLRADINEAAAQQARALVDRVPPDISVEYRLVPRTAIRAIRAELNQGRFDLCLCRSRRSRPSWWRGVGYVRLWREARAVNRANRDESEIAKTAIAVS